MSTPDIAARLLLATDEALADEALELADQLNEENLRRQDEEAGHRRRGAAHRRERPGRRRADRARGGGGGLASRRDRDRRLASSSTPSTGRPSSCRSRADQAHGSCRSIPAFDMLDALESAAAIMVRFGGHKAGGRPHHATRDRCRRASDRRQRDADERLGPDDLRPRLRIDAALAVPAASAVRWSRRWWRWRLSASATRGRSSAVDGRDRRRPAPSQGSAPQDGAPPERPSVPGHRLAWRRAARRSSRHQRAPWTWPSRSPEYVQRRDAGRADRGRHPAGAPRRRWRASPAARHAGARAVNIGSSSCAGSWLLVGRVAIALYRSLRHAASAPARPRVARIDPKAVDRGHQGRRVLQWARMRCRFMDFEQAVRVRRTGRAS